MEKGLTNVAALQGGWKAWQQAGYPVEGTKVEPPPTGDEASVLGDPGAPVTIIEFSDFQCPYCRQYVLQTKPQIRESYIDTGKVHYIFRDFPLSSHANALEAAEAARCAGAQGAYWAMHDQLFKDQSRWAKQDPEQVIAIFASYAQDLGLDGDALRTCLESDQFVEQIAQDVQQGEQNGVSGTPTFFINGQLMAGAYPFENFQQVIEAELAKEQ
jgi:protein-disulfide isomerase